MDNDEFQRLSVINDQLIQVCDWLNEKRLISITDDLTHLVAEMSVKKKS